MRRNGRYYLTLLPYVTFHKDTFFGAANFFPLFFSQGPVKSYSDIFGMEGSFRQLEFD